jgi:hypothetical protein
LTKVSTNRFFGDRLLSGAYGAGMKPKERIGGTMGGEG